MRVVGSFPSERGSAGGSPSTFLHLLQKKNLRGQLHGTGFTAMFLTCVTDVVDESLDAWRHSQRVVNKVSP